MKPSISKSAAFCLALAASAVQCTQLPNSLYADPITPPPAHAIGTVRDVCSNWWTLAPAEGNTRQLLVLPGQDPTTWRAPNVKGLSNENWRGLYVGDEGFVWLTGDRTIRFDPRKPDAGAAEAVMPGPKPESPWKVVARMPASNHDVTAAVLGNKVFIAGGLSADFGFPARSHSFDEAWELDVKTWTWRVAAKLFRDRIYCATAAFDGKIWVIGGDVIEPNGKRSAVTTIELIDPVTGVVTRGVESTIARPMPLAMEANGRLYVMGNPLGEFDKPGKIESIGVGEKSWRQEPDGPVGMSALAGTSLNGKLYVMIPKQGLAVFDTQTAKWEMIAPPSIPVSNQMAAYRDEIWMIGGWGPKDPLQTLIFDPRARTFRQGPPTPVALSWGGAAVVNGKLIITGGAGLRSDKDRVFIYSDRTYVLQE